MIRSVVYAAAASLLVASVEASDSLDFAGIANVADRKQAFVNFMLPHVRVANDEVWAQRMEIENIRAGEEVTPGQRSRLVALGAMYAVPSPMAIDEPYFRSLLRRVDVVPAALVLAQAAIESGWGKSKFARKGNNYFGTWCYRPGCGITPEHRKPGGTHEVRRFDSVTDGVRHFLRNINTNRAFRKLHEIREAARMRGESPVSLDLAEGLGKYSQRREAYVTEIQMIIRQNELRQYTLKRSPDFGE